MSLVFTIARRELRGGLQGLRVFLACLALGVAAIAAVAPEDFAAQLAEHAAALPAISLLGACCGSTPAWISALARRVQPGPEDRRRGFARLAAGTSRAIM